MTEGSIRILDPMVADQIAAGEVVERPASVIKELLENSLDAGATRVQVEIDAGGIARIRVVDNGVGLSAADAALAFTRHATSKIRRLEDIERVESFGFRGEALPSIASVSRVRILTRAADAVAGTRLLLEGGEVKQSREAGCPVGTDFEVTDLFYNTPARLKFLKRDTTEAGHCAEALVRLALVRPEVSFAFVSQGRRTRELPRVERPQERVASLFPDEPLAVSDGLAEGIRVLAILGPPHRARPGAGSLYTYVNGRFIRDRALLRAVTQAFAGTLESGRYPVGFISLALPPGSFDVNVHPQKTEVRFVDQGAVYRAVTRVVGEMAARSVWALGCVASGQPDRQPAGVADPGVEYSAPAGRMIPAPPRAAAHRPVAMGDLLRDVGPRPGGPVATGGEVPAPPGADRRGRERFSSLRYLGQARGTFLLLEDEDDLVIIDQHAAHERVKFERLRLQLDKGRVSSQRLLAPHSIDLGPAEAERIADLEDRLAVLGLEVTRSGPDRIAIRAVPSELAGASPDRLLADMVLALEERRDGSRGETDDHVLATMACHGSIRGGRPVAEAEVAELLTQMDRIDFAGHCPHGRPVLARFPWAEIRKRVGRD